jgi:CheY-like chemotaxis protein
MSPLVDSHKPIEILLAEDNPGDVRLTREALKDARVSNNLSVVADGVETMAFLRHEGRYADAPQPNLILLDLNMPHMDGRQVLATIKADDDLRRIPVVVLSTSQDRQDIQRAYALQANCYVTKPADYEDFVNVVKSVEEYWAAVAQLPPAQFA